MQQELIQVNNISKIYKIRKKAKGIKGLIFPEYIHKKAVNEISFSINRGEMVGFIGPNGAGKSTTIKMLSGILYPDCGSISVNGMIPYKDRKKYVAHIGAVFGQKSQLSWDLPVIDSFELVKHIYKIPEKKYRENLETFIEMLDMKEFLNQPVRQLSLGQRMRADIVASLLYSPKIVFFDEPTIGLDVVAKEKIRKFIKYINEKYNVTMIFTTHDMQDIEKTCKRLIIIDTGKILYDGKIEEIKKRFGAIRQINLEFEEEAELSPIENTEIFIDEKNKRKVKIIFDPSVVSMDRFMTGILATYHISDITITEPEIDSIIRRIYEGGMCER